LIFHYPYGSFNFHQVGMVLLWLALITTLYSGASYFQTFFKEATTGRPRS
jgi:phosphatidylglycerophosphate synthase